MGADVEIGGASPFFIVTDVARSVGFYGDRLGFEAVFRNSGEDLFFAIVRRGGAMIFLKCEAGVEPLPNPRRHPRMRWDAYVDVADPDALAAEFRARGVGFSEPLKDTDDGLRGFELCDPDGHVLFFGRPR